MKNNDHEHEEQKKVMVWARANTPRFRELVLLHAIPNGGYRTMQVAVKLKAEGVKKGVSDLMLPVARGDYHGLYIEMKAGNGRASEEQKHFIESVRTQGYYADVAVGHEQAVGILESYLVGSPTSYRYAPKDDSDMGFIAL